MSKEQLETMLSRYGLKKDLPAKELTNFHIGGPCDYVVYPTSYEDVVDIIRLSKNYDLPVFVIGRGTNLLVSDKGIRGIVMILSDNFSDVELEGSDVVCASAGTSLKQVSDFALENSLTGFEFACGIPGGVGGAVTMNAGAYDSNMENVVLEVTALNRDLEIITLTNEQMHFSYRFSTVSEKNLIVLGVKYKLQKGNKEEIKARVDDFTFKRTSKQPLIAYSAGSTFKRPQGHYASKLIQDSGLKGLVMGNVAVSGLHSGFVINTGSATCEEVLEMIEFIKQVVGNKFGVTLEEEVKIVGDFS